jgi:hypothetical protein
MTDYQKRNADLEAMLKAGNPTHPITMRELVEVRKTPAVAIFCIRMQTAEIARLRAALERIGNPEFIYACDEHDGGCTPLTHRMDDARATLRGELSHTQGAKSDAT